MESQPKRVRSSRLHNLLGGLASFGQGMADLIPYRQTAKKPDKAVEEIGDTFQEVGDGLRDTVDLPTKVQAERIYQELMDEVRKTKQEQGKGGSR